MSLSSYEIVTTFSGISVLSDLHQQIKKTDPGDVIVDCSRLNWMDAHLGAALLTISSHARQQGKTLRIDKLRPDIASILRKNGTLSRHLHDVHGTTVPVAFYKMDDSVKFAQDTRKSLAHEQMPRMSKELSLKFFEGIDEIFANANLHSKATVPIITAGQYFPRLEKLSFVISDGGIGIEECLARVGRQFPNAGLAIEWAMELNNSSRIGDVPGGLGLGILKDFIKLNKGCMLVCSHNGYWELRNGVVRHGVVPVAFPGTMVSLEINTSDRSSYSLRASVSPQNIW